MADEAVRGISVLPQPDVAIAQYRFVKAGATGITQCVAGDDAIGISLMASKDSTVAGTSLSEASAAIAIGLLDGSMQSVVLGATVAAPNSIGSDADGRAIVATGKILAQLIEGGGNVNEVVSVHTTKGAGA